MTNVNFVLRGKDLRVILAATPFTATPDRNIPALENVVLVATTTEDTRSVAVVATDSFTLFHSELPAFTPVYIDSTGVETEEILLGPEFISMVKSVVKTKRDELREFTLDADTYAHTWTLTSDNGDEHTGPLGDVGGRSYPPLKTLLKLFKDKDKTLFPVARAFNPELLARLHKSDTLARTDKTERVWAMGTTEPDNPRSAVTFASRWARVLLMPIRSYGSFSGYSLGEL